MQFHENIFYSLTRYSANNSMLLHAQRRLAQNSLTMPADEETSRNVGGDASLCPDATSTTAATSLAHPSVNEKLREIQLSLAHMSAGSADSNSSNNNKQWHVAAALPIGGKLSKSLLPSKNDAETAALQQQEQLLSQSNVSNLSSNLLLLPTTSSLSAAAAASSKSPDLDYFDPLAVVAPSSLVQISPMKVLKKSRSADNLSVAADLLLSSKSALFPPPPYYAVHQQNGHIHAANLLSGGDQQQNNFGTHAISHGQSHYGGANQQQQFYPGDAFLNGSFYNTMNYNDNNPATRFVAPHPRMSCVVANNYSARAEAQSLAAGAFPSTTTAGGMTTSKSGIFAPRAQMLFPGFVTLSSSSSSSAVPPPRFSPSSAASTAPSSTFAPRLPFTNGFVGPHPPHHFHYSHQQQLDTSGGFASNGVLSPEQQQQHFNRHQSQNFSLNQHSHPSPYPHNFHHTNNNTNGSTTLPHTQLYSSNIIGNAVNMMPVNGIPPSTAQFADAVASFGYNQQTMAGKAVGDGKTVGRRRRRQQRRLLPRSNNNNNNNSRQHDDAEYCAISGATPTNNNNNNDDDDEVGHIPPAANGHTDSENDDDDDDSNAEESDENNTIQDTPEPEDDVEYESRKLILQQQQHLQTAAVAGMSAGGSARYVHARPPHPHSTTAAAHPSASFLHNNENNNNNFDANHRRRPSTCSSSSASAASSVATTNGGGGGAKSHANSMQQSDALAATAAAAAAATADNLRDGAAVVMHAAYLGSTHLFCESRVSRATRLAQCQEALARIKAPDGESQPMIDVDICISIEKVAVVNTDTAQVLMEHALRTISYTADMGDLVVLMVKRSLDDLQQVLKPNTATQPKMLCHVFQSTAAPTIAQCVGQAFQVAYVEFLKANGVQDERYLRMLDYQEVLASQEMSSDELDAFAARDRQKDVIIPKQKQEPLGIVIVESGWGSLVPTVVVANIAPGGAAGRTGKLNIGDQILSVDGVSCVGLPLKRCQQLLKDTRPNKLAVKLSVVPTSPVVSVRIRRPDTRYQLGFSVQNGIICSLLRGGIAERGGIRVGHRIIEINGQSVVSTSHEQIVNMLAHSVGDILIKTMPTSIYRLLTGQEQPVYI